MVGTIISNLLSNAIKFTPKGGKIQLFAEPLDGFIKISIKDSGFGKPKEKINDLFKIESNNSTYGTENQKGTGIGLILCKEFTEKHGGKISVKSEVNIGSTLVSLLKTKLANTC